ncbi:MAG: hypothetical protein HONBIEJF_02323 [Fimbriimonadaceae bacterium]|nr:hypothetical protein [Fimbriimonadaceae bacterium]
MVSDVSDEMDLAVLKGCVIQAYEELPPIYRDVYRLAELEEHSVRETAERLDLTEAATKSRLLRARELMRNRLDGSICGS